MRAVLALCFEVFVGACGGASPAPPIAPPVAPPASPAVGESAVAAPAAPTAAPRARGPSLPRRLIPGLDPLVSGATRVIVIGRDELPVAEGPSFRFRDSSGKKSDYWSPCVRDFVRTQPDAASDALGDALSLFSTACTPPPRMRVELRVPRPVRNAPLPSHLGLIGALEPATCELALEAAYHGEPIHAERITLIADGVRWTSTRLDFDRDDGWEIATLPLTRSLARVVERALDARDTLLRFESATGYEDVVVGDDLKQDLRVMLDALAAINRP